MSLTLQQTILNRHQIEYALFNSSLLLTDWSIGLVNWLPDRKILAKGAKVPDLFPELNGYEDILTKILSGNDEFLSLDQIARQFPQSTPLFDMGQTHEYYSLDAYRFEEQLIITIKDVTSQAGFEQLIIQRRNELDLSNIKLINELKNANDELSDAYVTTLEGWARALELRDLETQGHSRRVVDLTLMLGRLMGISEEELKYHSYGALLHDIGKMGIPDSILKKTGIFSLDERDIMNQHPLFAYNLLSPIKYLEKALDIPHYHHEKWDGSGYPEGLKEEQIPLAARIFAIVDVYDALISDRTYHEHFSKEDVKRMIREGSGIHFDPRIVEIFLANI